MVSVFTLTQTLVVILPTSCPGDVADPCSASTTILIDDDKTITAALESGERVCGDLCHPIQQGDLNNEPTTLLLLGLGALMVRRKR